MNKERGTAVTTGCFDSMTPNILMAPVIGIVTRYNRKSVTVLTKDGQRWNGAGCL